MNKHLFGEVSLPQIDTVSGYPYMLIVKTNTYILDTDLMLYWLCFSDQPFYSGKFTSLATGIEEEGICFGVSSNILLYQALSESISWSQITPQYDTTSVQWIKVGNYEDYIWSSDNITDFNTGETKFTYYNPILITEAAEQPQLSYLTSAPTYEIFDMASEIICSAISPDGGELSYKWYEYGIGPVSNYSFFTPPTYIIKEENGEKIATTGSRTYYCIVINSKNNTRTSSTVSIVLTIKEPAPVLENNFNFTLGQILGNHFKRLSITDEKKPQVDLDFENYAENSEVIQNKGSTGASQNATVILNSGQAYSSNKGLMLTKDANFYIPTNIIFNTNSLKFGTAFTYIVAISDFIFSESNIQKLCLGTENLFSVFYDKEIGKFNAVLVDSPNSNFPKFSYNSEIISYMTNGAYAFDLKANDIISFVHDTQEAILYINEKWAMKMPSPHIFFPDFPNLDIMINEKQIDKIGCGDIENSGNTFEQLTIKRFLYYNYALSKSQIKHVVDDIKKSKINISVDKEDNDEDTIYPIAYLYNEVRYPVVSEYDVVEYPFAFIIVGYPHTTYNTYRASNKQLTYRGTNSEGSDVYAFDDDAKYIDIRVRVNTENIIGTTWSNWIENAGSGDIQVSSGESPVFWSNYDLYGRNGLLVSTASDPIPVYGA